MDRLGNQRRAVYPAGGLRRSDSEGLAIERSATWVT